MFKFFQAFKWFTQTVSKAPPPPPKTFFTTQNKVLLFGTSVGALFGFSEYEDGQSHYQNSTVPIGSLMQRKDYPKIDASDIGYYLRKIGLTFHDENGAKITSLRNQDYFVKDAAYELDPTLVKQISEASYEMHNMCLEAVENVVNSEELMDVFEIPINMRDAVRKSWENREGDLIGRFDFLYDGQNPPKMIEYNADTPTTLLESSRGQAYWARQAGKIDKQYNYLSAAIGFSLQQYIDNKTSELVFAGDKGSKEEWSQIKYLESVAKSYGFKFARSVSYSLLRFDMTDNKMKVDDQANEKIDSLFKLYPLEWMSREEISSAFDPLHDYRPEIKHQKIYEPVWKIILSNKAILPYLWELFPDHPNLLPAYFTEPSFADQFNDWEFRAKEWVAKPKFGRGGEGILKSTDKNWDTFLEEAKKEVKVVYNNLSNNEGRISIGNNIIQQFYQTPIFSGRRCMIGSWMIMGVPAGIGIREEHHDHVVQEHSSFVPHYVQAQESSIFYGSNTANISFDRGNYLQDKLRRELYRNKDVWLTRQLFDEENKSQLERDFEQSLNGPDNDGYGRGGGGTAGRTHRSSDSSGSGSGGGSSAIFYDVSQQQSKGDKVTQARSSFKDKVKQSSSGNRSRLASSSKNPKISTGNIGRGLGRASS